MGAKNAELIQAAERARKVWEWFQDEVERSQRTCPHPTERRMRGNANELGVRPVICLDCSAKVG